MEKNFVLTENDVHRLHSFLIFQANRTLLAAVFFGALFIAGVVGQALPASAALIGYIGAFVLGFWGLLLLMRGLTLRQARNNGVLGTWRIDVSNEGVTSYPPNKNRAFIPWRNLVGILQSKQYIFLFTSRTTAILVPKTAFDPHEQTQFVNLIEEFTREAPYAPIFNRRTFLRGTKTPGSRLTSKIVIVVLILLVVVGVVNWFTT